MSLHPARIDGGRADGGLAELELGGPRRVGMCGNVGGKGRGVRTPVQHAAPDFDAQCRRLGHSRPDAPLRDCGGE